MLLVCLPVTYLQCILFYRIDEHLVVELDDVCTCPSPRNHHLTYNDSSMLFPPRNIHIDDPSKIQLLCVYEIAPHLACHGVDTAQDDGVEMTIDEEFVFAGEDVAEERPDGFGQLGGDGLKHRNSTSA